MAGRTCQDGGGGRCSLACREAISSRTGHQAVDTTHIPDASVVEDPSLGIHLLWVILKEMKVAPGSPLLLHVQSVEGVVFIVELCNHLCIPGECIPDDCQMGVISVGQGKLSREEGYKRKGHALSQDTPPVLHPGG